MRSVGVVLALAIDTLRALGYAQQAGANPGGELPLGARRANQPLEVAGGSA